MLEARDCRKAKENNACVFSHCACLRPSYENSKYALTVTTLVTSFGKTNSLILIKRFSFVDSECCDSLCHVTFRVFLSQFSFIFLARELPREKSEKLFLLNSTLSLLRDFIRFARHRKVGAGKKWNDSQSVKKKIRKRFMSENFIWNCFSLQ